jgi:hypothetical protein
MFSFAITGGTFGTCPGSLDVERNALIARACGATIDVFDVCKGDSETAAGSRDGRGNVEIDVVVARFAKYGMAGIRVRWPADCVVHLEWPHSLIAIESATHILANSHTRLTVRAKWAVV